MALTDFSLLPSILTSTNQQRQIAIAEVLMCEVDIDHPSKHFVGSVGIMDYWIKWISIKQMNLEETRPTPPSIYIDCHSTALL